MFLDYHAPRPSTQELQDPAARKQGRIQESGVFLHSHFKDSPSIPWVASMRHPGCQGDIHWFSSHSVAATHEPSQEPSNTSSISRMRGSLALQLLPLTLWKFVILQG